MRGALRCCKGFRDEHRGMIFSRLTLATRPSAVTAFGTFCPSQSVFTETREAPSALARLCAKSNPSPTSACALAHPRATAWNVKTDGRFAGLTAGCAKGPARKASVSRCPIYPVRWNCRSNHRRLRRRDTAVALADGGRLVASGVPADHGEREVPGVADIDDRQ